ncbi:hypothetical protein AGR1C_pAt30007 [Agrobacterium fabacearum TT111]|nr:hypothetical protein AGR1C_pAt30007 [Agrobacterium fabacearum TT111]
MTIITNSRGPTSGARTHLHSYSFGNADLVWQYSLPRRFQSYWLNGLNYKFSETYHQRWTLDRSSRTDDNRYWHYHT